MMQPLRQSQWKIHKRRLRQRRHHLTESLPERLDGLVAASAAFFAAKCFGGTSEDLAEADCEVCHDAEENVRSCRYGIPAEILDRDGFGLVAWILLVFEIRSGTALLLDGQRNEKTYSSKSFGSRFFCSTSI